MGEDPLLYTPFTHDAKILHPYKRSLHSGECTCTQNGGQCDICCGRCCTRITGLGVCGNNGFVILDSINLHIHCGELTAIVGRNGAGKSTFFKAILGEIQHSGTITFISGKTSGKQRPRIGYVPQKTDLAVGSPISVMDVLRASTSKKPAWLLPSPTEKERVRTALQVTGAESLLNRRMSDLSGGELQRVMLALALTPVPDILLLDEPVSGIDRNGLLDFYALVSTLRRTYDMTILLISHDLDIVACHADRVVLLDKTVLAEGSPAKVYQSKPFIETFGKIVIEPEDGQ